ENLVAKSRRCQSARCEIYFSNCRAASILIISTPAPEHSINKKVPPESGTDLGGGSELGGETTGWSSINGVCPGRRGIDGCSAKAAGFPRLTLKTWTRLTETLASLESTPLDSTPLAPKWRSSRL